MNLLIREYVKNLTEEEIYNFALKEGITLLDDETKVIYMYIKNYWQEFLESDPTYLFEELKEKLRDEPYRKIVELYNKYKKK
ncbi:MAG: DUF2624 family protein [Bacilli bacterium]|nr:DUF2624 family protein [Bacilli bacterium]